MVEAGRAGQGRRLAVGPGRAVCESLRHAERGGDVDAEDQADEGGQGRTGSSSGSNTVNVNIAILKISLQE